MKRCQTCQKTYNDESLNFCLDDGATLVSVAERPSSRDSVPTVVLSERTESLDVPPPTEVFIPPTQVYIPQTEAYVPRGTPTDHIPSIPATSHAHQRYTAPDAYLASQQPKPRSNLLIAGVTAITILLLVLVGIGIALLMRGSDSGSGANNAGKAANGNSQNGAQTDNSTSKSNANNQNADSTSSTNDTHGPGSLSVTATSSSTRVPLKAFSYAAANALDKSLLTAWIEGVPGPGIGEWIRCDFDREVKLNNVMITPGYFKTAPLWKQNNRLAAATLYFSDGTSRRFTFPDRMQMQTLDTGGIRTRFVRLVIEDFYPGSVDSEDTPISEMSFKWEP